MTTLRELHTALGELLDVEGGTEVLIASQPVWPFENHIAEFKVVEFAADHPFDNAHSGICLDCGQAADAEDHQMVTKLYIVEGGQIGYLPGEAKEQLGW